MSCIISLYLLNTIMASADSNMLDMESEKGEEEGEDGGRGRMGGGGGEQVRKEEGRERGEDERRATPNNYLTCTESGSFR